MHPIAVDIASFSEDLCTGTLRVCDLPRLAREVGVGALDLPLPLLLALDPHTTGPALRQEMEKHGVVLAAVRDQSICHLDEGPSYFGAPRWTPLWWDACRILAEGGWGAGLVILRPPPSTALAIFNRIAANVSRARIIAAEWGLRVAASDEDTRSCLGLVRDVPGLGLMIDGDRLPTDPTARICALEDALPALRLLHLVADGSGEDTRVLGAWGRLLEASAFDGFVSVQYTGTGDTYSGMGTAIRLLQGRKSIQSSAERPHRTTAPHHRQR